MAVSHGQAINLAGWISLITMCLAVLMKVSSKFIKIQRFQFDDWFLLGTMVFGIGQTVANSQAVGFGLGTPEAQLSSAALEGVEKALYASQMLFIPCVALPKIATSVFVGRLSLERGVRHSAYAISAVCGAWLVSGALATAFQCVPPNTWEVVPGKCIHWTSFWSIMAAVDILLDSVEFGLIAYVCWTLRMATSLKLSLLAGFAARFLIAPLNILRVIYIHQAYSSPDLSYGFYTAAIVTELIVNLGIAVHCLPFTKPVTLSLEHGFFSTDVRNTLRIDSEKRNNSLSQAPPPKISGGLPLQQGGQIPRSVSDF